MSLFRLWDQKVFRRCYTAWKITREVSRTWARWAGAAHPQRRHAGYKSQLGRSKHFQLCDGQHGRDTTRFVRFESWGSLNGISFRGSKYRLDIGLQ